MSVLIEPRFIESSDTARRLDVAVSTLKKWERLGRFAPAARTVGGRRLYTVEQVEELRARRQAQEAPPLDAA